MPTVGELLKNVKVKITTPPPNENKMSAAKLLAAYQQQNKTFRSSLEELLRENITTRHVSKDIMEIYHETMKENKKLKTILILVLILVVLTIVITIIAVNSINTGLKPDGG